MAKPKLVIGNKNYSSWSLRAWLVLKHLDVEFEEIRIPLYVKGYKEKLYEYSASGKVPVYIDGSNTVWDSLSICEYLAESHPQLWPTDITARATARSISAEMHSSFMALRDEMPMNCRAKHRSVKLTEQARIDVSRIQEIWGLCRRKYSEQGPWLFGAFSIADVMYAPVASRFQTYDISLEETGRAYAETVLLDPHIQQWYADSEAEPEVITEYEVGQ
ncbi:MAG: glutathione S-transferase family protein [Arenicellales bacterium]|nr:glutathione S-transferase family protein [Arenicellales bacterium]